MLYRVLKRLSLGGDKAVEKGEFTSLEWLDERGVSRLMAAGAVSEVAPPPLSELPGWKGRAERLAAIDIGDAVEFLEAEPDVLAPKLRVKPATVTRWQREVKRWLVVEKKRG